MPFLFVAFLSTLLGGAASWRTGRATYYGGPSTLGATFDAARGQGSFGILAYGSCGYTNSDGSLVFGAAEYAAAADANADYPGSCGRCYEVKCVNGHVYDDPGTPVNIVGGLFNGDIMRPYLPAISRGFKDTEGRSFPGNPEEAQGGFYVKCWDPSKTVRVRIGDSCPCRQVLPEGAPGVKKGGEVRRQTWCCGGEEHFDLSYFAFEQLAHPLYGAMMLQYRPVDCSSGAELSFTPGFVSKTIFQNVPQPGWGLSLDKKAWFYRVESGVAPGGSGALCVSLQPSGVLSFRCRNGYQAGYQPFAGANAVQFWIKGNGRELPTLKLYLLKEESHQYCGAEPTLQAADMVDQSGDWLKLVVPISRFNCGSGSISESQADNLSFEAQQSFQSFCLADIQIL